MSKLTLEEKRLRQIKQQLFGKDNSSPSKSVNKFSSGSPVVSAETMPISDVKTQSVSGLISDNVYLKNDLLKIVFLTASVLFIQFILYYGIQMKLIHLGF